MKVLITGAKGVSGRHLTELLTSESGLELYWSDLANENTENYHVADLSKISHAYRLIREIAPQQVYNLAGTFSNDYKTDYRANVLLSKNILDSVLKAGITCRVMLIGSSAEYGPVSERDNPIKETQELRPASFYGLTKTYQTQMMRLYHTTFKMDVVMARPFNLLGEGFSNKLFIGRVWEQIQKYREGNLDRITLGSLDSKRDYIDVREAVKYYRLIMNFGKCGDIYNVGSGKSIKIYDLLLKILKDNKLDVNVVEKEIIMEKRESDTKDIYADITKIKELCQDSRCLLQSI